MLGLVMILGPAKSLFYPSPTKSCPFKMVQLWRQPHLGKLLSDLTKVCGFHYQLYINPSSWRQNARQEICGQEEARHCCKTWLGSIAARTIYLSVAAHANKESLCNMGQISNTKNINISCWLLPFILLLLYFGSCFDV